jgi:hypothetical protein
MPPSRFGAAGSPISINCRPPIVVGYTTERAVKGNGTCGTGRVHRGQQSRFARGGQIEEAKARRAVGNEGSLPIDRGGTGLRRHASGADDARQFLGLDPEGTEAGITIGGENQVAGNDKFSRVIETVVCRSLAHLRACPRLQRVGDVKDRYTLPPFGNIGKRSAGLDARRSARRHCRRQQERARRLADVDDSYAAGSGGDISQPALDVDIVRGADTLEAAQHYRLLAVRNVDDQQPLLTGRHVGRRAQDLDVNGGRCQPPPDDGRPTVAHVDDEEPRVLVGDIGIASGNGYAPSAARQATNDHWRGRIAHVYDLETIAPDHVRVGPLVRHSIVAVGPQRDAAQGAQMTRVGDVHDDQSRGNLRQPVGEVARDRQVSQPLRIWDGAEIVDAAAHIVRAGPRRRRGPEPRHERKGQDRHGRARHTAKVPHSAYAAILAHIPHGFPCSADFNSLIATRSS